MKDIYVFDVDDTLIDTRACIRAVDRDGHTVFRAGTKAFNAPDSTSRLLTPGLRWDFTEFISLDQIMSEPTRKPFETLKSLAADPRNVSDIYICTCRQARTMLWNWLALNGIKIPLTNIYCYDASTGLTSAEWKGKTVCSIARKYNQEDCVVHVWEDDKNFKESIFDELSLALIQYVDEPLD